MPANIICPCDSSFNSSFSVPGSWSCTGSSCCQLVSSYFLLASRGPYWFGALCVWEGGMLACRQFCRCCVIPVVVFAPVFSVCPGHSSGTLAVIWIPWSWDLVFFSFYPNWFKNNNNNNNSFFFSFMFCISMSQKNLGPTLNILDFQKGINNIQWIITFRQ